MLSALRCARQCDASDLGCILQSSASPKPQAVDPQRTRAGLPQPGHANIDAAFLDLAMEVWPDKDFEWPALVNQNEVLRMTCAAG